MKRCPQCNRVETDDTLAFCRADGTSLIIDAASVNRDAGTIKFDSDSMASEVATSVLPAASTSPEINRSTGPTTVLSTPSTHSPVAPSRSRRGLILVFVFLIAAASIVGYVYFTKKPSAAIQSIAVMPFVNAGNNPDVEYLSDGMTETLINTLSQLPDVSVKARSSVSRYKGKEVEPHTVGSELNVQAIVNGRVVQRADELTVYLSLVDTRTGNQLWGEQYTRKQSDLLTLQATVGRDVATKIKTKLSGTDEQKVAKSYTQNSEAYQLYLQGRFFANKRTPQTLQKAIELYQQAIAKDPNYALGYAGLSDGYSLLAYYGGMAPPLALSKAREAALRAMSLDDNLAESHNALGFVFTVADFDYAAGEREYKRAIQLDPNYTTAHHNLGVMLTRTGRPDEGMAELRRALEIEPFSIVVNRLYGECLAYLRRYDEGLAQLKKTTEMDPSFPSNHSALSNVYRLMGRHTESVESYARFHELFDRPQTAAMVRASFATGGWQGFLREMTSKRPSGVSPYMAAIMFVELGEKEKAFAELEKSYELREYLLRFIKIDPSVDLLRDDPRFKDLLRRMKLD
jgi:TolB-like protein/Tfp pilus assembly protein PilF